MEIRMSLWTNVFRSLPFLEKMETVFMTIPLLRFWKSELQESGLMSFSILGVENGLQEQGVMFMSVQGFHRVGP